MEHRAALVTGAGRGIGRAVAIELARLNYRVSILARTQSDLEQTRSLCTGEICILNMNIGQSQAAEDAVAQTVERFGRLDAIVHCAGSAPVLKVEETTDVHWQEVIDTNLSAAFFLARAAWPVFKRQNSGVVVNISSLASRDPFAGFIAYGAAKAGVNVLGLSLAREGQDHGIRVHTIAPGATETDMFRKLMTPEQFPVERTMQPADVANVVAKCVTGELAHTSGEVIWLHKTV